MIRLQVVSALVAFGAVLAFASSARAQATDYRYKPTLSPWFGLYQKNGGPLDNYHTFVRPQLDLQDTMQRQQNAIQRNQAGLDTLGQDVNQMHQKGTIRTTGTGSGFMNYSHYYPAQGGRAPQPASHGSWSPPPASSARGMASMSSGRF